MTAERPCPYAIRLITGRCLCDLTDRLCKYERGHKCEVYEDFLDGIYQEDGDE